MSSIYIDGKPKQMSRAEYCEIGNRAKAKKQTLQEAAAEFFGKSAAKKKSRKAPAKKIGG